MDDIDEMPTAFDKEKVIQELKHIEGDAEKIWVDSNNDENYGSMKAYTRAVEIVKKGGSE